MQPSFDDIHKESALCADLPTEASVLAACTGATAAFVVLPSSSTCAAAYSASAGLMGISGKLHPAARIVMQISAVLHERVVELMPFLMLKQTT